MSLLTIGHGGTPARRRGVGATRVRTMLPAAMFQRSVCKGVQETTFDNMATTIFCGTTVIISSTGWEISCVKIIDGLVRDGVRTIIMDEATEVTEAKVAITTMDTCMHQQLVTKVSFVICGQNFLVFYFSDYYSYNSVHNYVLFLCKIMFN